MVNFFLKPRKRMGTGIIRSFLITAGLSCMCAAGVLAEDHEDEKLKLTGIRKTTSMKLLPSPPTGTELYMPDTTLKGVLKNNLIVSGTVRFLTLYRDMSQFYSDLQTSSKSFSFTEYQAAGGGTGTANTGGVPNLELLLSSKISNSFNFNVGYSYSYLFTGTYGPKSSQGKLSSNNNLWFSGTLSSKVVNFNMSAGTVLWTAMSRFTMGQPNYRDNYFLRLPWDWYRQSFTRWDEYYSLTTNVGAQGNGRSPLSGFVATADFYKIGLSITGIYGRTNRTLSYAYQNANYPGYLSGLKIEKSIFNRYIDGRFGLNIYTRSSYTDTYSGIRDMNQIISLDGRVRWKKVLFSTEVGRGMVNNPESNKQSGYGFFFRTDFDKKISTIPFSAEVYNIDYNMASIDGGILNSNTSVRDGGYHANVTSEQSFIYDNMMLINVAQEVGMLANNRRGVFLNGEAQVQRLKIQLGMGISQEINNLHDTITIQHKVAAFTRSRFYPWFSAGGPYARLKNTWMRSFETFTITDQNTNYKKGFNTIELLLKYKATFLGKEMVFLYFNNFNSIQDKLSAIPIFTNNNSAFVRQYFSDLTIAYKLSKSVSLSGYGGIERLWGSKRINVADANGNEIRDANGRPIADPNGLAVNQIGTMYGFGIDYDFSPTAGLHFRQYWFSSKDTHFKLDVFKGYETNVELKIFF